MTPRKTPQLGPLKPAAPTDADPLRAEPRRLAPRFDPENMRKKSKPSGLWRRLFWGLLALLLCLTVVPVLVLGVLPVGTSSFMLQYQFERLSSARDRPPLSQQWVPWEQISPAAKLAVIAAEDQRFAVHPGIDFRAVGKAIEHNRDGGSTRGASTISQQLAKNLFLWPGRSWFRKGLETGYTLLIELLWSKRRILEVYLNVAEFGPGVYGVEAASNRYYRKSAANLTHHEAALLAAVLPNPKRRTVVSPSLYVQNRAEWIRGQMQQLGMATLETL